MCKGVAWKMSLKAKIKNMFDENRGLAIEIAKKAGFKNATPLYKFLNEPDRELDNFSSLLTIVRELFDNEVKVMADYILTLEPCKKTARYSLEYLSINKMHEVKEQLINKMLKCKNAESKEWATMYQLNMLGERGICSPYELLNMLNEFQPKSIEMITLRDIEKFYCYYDLKIIDNMIPQEKFVRINLMQIKEMFVRNSYKNRLTIICVDGALHNNDVKKVREYEANAKIEFDYNITKFSLQMGNSYMFESFDVSNDYLLKSLDAAKRLDDSHRINEAQRSLNFLYSYYNKEAMFLNFDSKEVSDIHEVAFYYIRKGDKRGLEILESMDLEKLTDHNKGFHFFYRGLATMDEDYFWDSLLYFNISGEKFYKNISLNELRRLGVSDRKLMALAV